MHGKENSKNCFPCIPSWNEVFDKKEENQNQESKTEIILKKVQSIEWTTGTPNSLMVIQL